MGKSLVSYSIPSTAARRCWKSALQQAKYVVGPQVMARVKVKVRYRALVRVRFRFRLRVRVSYGES